MDRAHFPRRIQMSGNGGAGEPLIIEHPLLVGIDGVASRDARIAPFEAYREGKFVIGSDGGDRVRLYGALWGFCSSSIEEIPSQLANEHEIYLPDYLRHLGQDTSACRLVLGGGYLSVDHQARDLRVHNADTRLGAAPKALIENALVLPHYTVKVSHPSGSRGRYPEKARAEQEHWLYRHGFELQWR